MHPGNFWLRAILQCNHFHHISHSTLKLITSKQTNILSILNAIVISSMGINIRKLSSTERMKKVQLCNFALLSTHRYTRNESHENCDWTLKIFWNIIPGHKDIKVLELQFVYKITHYNEKSYLFSFDIDSRIFSGNFRKKYIIFCTFSWMNFNFFCDSAKLR